MKLQFISKKSSINKYHIKDTRQEFPYSKNMSNFPEFLNRLLVNLPILPMMILLQCDSSLGQMCSLSCTQTAIVRNMPYEEAYKIVQNREWELEDDFGDDSILIRRYKRVIINRDFSLFILKYISEVIVSYDHYRNHLQTEGPELYGVLALISERSFLHQEL